MYQYQLNYIEYLILLLNNNKNSEEVKGFQLTTMDNMITGIQKAHTQILHH